MSGTRSEGSSGDRRWASACFAVLLLAQSGLAIYGIAKPWQLGHNGFNGAAYHQGARNSIRFDTLFPAQYSSGLRRPGPKKLYTHAPLALHGHIVLSLLTLGDHTWAVRLPAAVYGVLALWALLHVVRRRWGAAHAVLCGALYILLPINHALINMVNHTAGFILWSLLTIECYLRLAPADDDDHAEPHARSRGIRMLAFFFCAFWAMQWDWPAYYVMFLIAAHWLLRLWSPKAGARAARSPLRAYLPLAGFCALVLASFIGFFALAHAAAGGFDELGRTLERRTQTAQNFYQLLWSRSLSPMFSAPVLLTGALWLADWLWRLTRGRARARDLVPTSFAAAGILHTLLFKGEALVHNYWAWPLNPFVAFAGADLALRVGDWLAGRLRAPLRWLPATGLLLALGLHSVPMFAEGRRTGGSFRRPMPDTGQVRAVVATEVRRRTDLKTGVAEYRLPYSIQDIATLDRFRRGQKSLVAKKPRPGVAPAGWVSVGRLSDTPVADFQRQAGQHPTTIIGDYYMIDFRSRGRDARVYALRAQPMTLGWRILVDAWEPPLRPVYDPEATSGLRTRLTAL